MKTTSTAKVILYTTQAPPRRAVPVSLTKQIEYNEAIAYTKDNTSI